MYEKPQRGFLITTAVLDIIACVFSFIMTFAFFIVLIDSMGYANTGFAILMFLLFGGAGGAFVAFGSLELGYNRRRGAEFRNKAKSLLAFSITKSVFSGIFFILMIAMTQETAFFLFMDLIFIASTVFSYLAWAGAKNEPDVIVDPNAAFVFRNGMSNPSSYAPNPFANPGYPQQNGFVQPGQGRPNAPSSQFPQGQNPSQQGQNSFQTPNQQVSNAYQAQPRVQPQPQTEQFDDVISKIARLNALRAQGAISGEEFDRLKGELMIHTSAPAVPSVQTSGFTEAPKVSAPAPGFAAAPGAPFPQSSPSEQTAPAVQRETLPDETDKNK